MDYFNTTTDEDFIKYFLDELYSKTEFVQEEDPDDFFDPEAEYGKHITETQEKLYVYIKREMSLSKSNLSDPKKTELFNLKREKLFETLNPQIDIYITKIKVDYK
ncbi:hypothetical protein [Flavobacterium denitrificans]|uniref:hypothetical protein n=1 Tax=Flavobacterium denitrificans TaxID=281361 RepID=UPI000420525A|nr:hypothetical protein [Flavobacterium denitrificans]